MVYARRSSYGRRRFRRRGRFRSRRRFMGRRRSYRRTRRFSRRLTRLGRPVAELKWITGLTNAFVMSAVGTTLSPLTGIAQGFGQGQRLGKQIYLAGLYFNFVMNPGPLAAVEHFRVTISLWPDFTDPATVPGLIYETVGALTLTQVPIRKDRKRFRILYDKRFRMQATTHLVAGPSVPTGNVVGGNYYIKKFFRMRKYVQYNDAEAPNPTTSNFDLHMTFLTDQPALSAGTAGGYIKMWFRDA